MKTLKKSLSLLLCFAMVIGSLTVTAVAAEGTAITTDKGLASSIKAGGTYYLANDITLTSDYTASSPGAAVTIDLNGHNITADSTFNSRFLTTAAYNRAVTIKNSQKTGGRIYDIKPSASAGSFIYYQLGMLTFGENVTIDNCGRSGNPLIKMAYNSTYTKAITFQCEIKNCKVTSIVDTYSAITKDGAQTINIKSGAKILGNTLSSGCAINMKAATTATFTKAFTYSQTAGYVESVNLGSDARIKATISGGYIGKLTADGNGFTNAITAGHYGTESSFTPKSGYIFVNPTIKDSGDNYPCDVVESTSTFSVKYYDGDTELTDLSNTSASCAGVTVPSTSKGEDTFTGWNTAANGSGIDVAAGSTLVGTKDQEITLYAQWQSAKKVFIHYFDGDTELEDIKTTSELNQQATLSAAPDKSGYVLKEWNTAADGTGTAYLPGTPIDMAEEDITLYAQWYNADDIVATVQPEDGAVSYFLDIESAVTAAVNASTNSTGSDAGTIGKNVTIKLFKDVYADQYKLRKSSSASYDTVKRTITFDLNGHMYKCTAGSTKGAFIVNKNTTVEIGGGGTFVAGYICNGNTGSKYTLKDGYYYGVSALKYGTTTSVTIQGGKFVNDPSSLLTTSYSVNPISEEHSGYTFKYEVVKETATVNVDGTKYNSITEAIGALKKDSTLTLLADATLTDVVTIDDPEATITINLGGYTLTAAEGKQLFNISAGDVNVKNGTLKTGATLIGTGHVYVKNAFLNLDNVTLDGSAITDESKIIYSEGIVTINSEITTSGDVYQAKSYADFTGISLSLSENLTMKYVCLVALASTDADKLISLNTSVGATSDQVAAHGNGEYEFENILTTAQMGNTVIAKIMVGDNAISKAYEYSVVNYAKDANEQFSDNENLKMLLANTLSFGVEVQKYWKEGTGTGAAFEVPSELKDAGTYVDVPSSANVSKVLAPRTTTYNKIKNATLYMSDKFAVRLSLYAKAGNKLEITIGGELYKTITIDKDYTESKLLTVTLPEMSPTEYNKKIVATLKTPSGDVLHAVSYSVNSYFYSKQNDSTVGTLCKAAYNYGRSACNYQYKVIYSEPFYTWNDDYTKCTATMKYEDGSVVTENATITRTVTTEKSSTSPEICSYTATFANSLFKTQVAEGVETRVIAIKANVTGDSVYLPTVKLSNQITYSEILTGGVVGDTNTFAEGDFKNVTFNDGVLKADIDMTVFSKNIKTSIELPIAAKVGVADALASQTGSEFLLSGVVVDSKSTDYRKDVVLYDAVSGKSVNVVFFTTDSTVLSNFTVGDKVSIPVKNVNGQMLYNGDYVWTNYIESTGNDVSGYTETFTEPSITSVVVSQMPAKTQYDYRPAKEDLILKGGKVTYTYSDGCTVVEDITKDMLTEDTNAETELGKLKYVVSADSVSASLVLNYSYVSVDEFNELEVGTATELHAIVVATSTNYAGAISLSNGEIIVRDVNTNSLMGIAGLNTTTARPFAEFAVGDEIIVSVTKKQYSTDNSNNEKEYASAKSITSYQIISQGNSTVVDKDSAVVISSQDEFREFLGENGSRKDSFYKLVKFEAGLKIGAYSSNSDSAYLYYDKTDGVKIDGLYPYLQSYNMTYNVGKTYYNMLGQTKVTSTSGGQLQDRDLYMVFIGGVGAYYHQFIFLDDSYIGDELALVKGTFTAPYKTQYLVGEELDLSGGSITETYTSKFYNNTVALDDSKVTIKSNNFNKDVEGTYQIVFTYNDRDYNFEVEVADKTVSSISLEAGLSGAVSHRATLDTIDLTGATINVTFGDSTSTLMPITRSMLPTDSSLAMGTNEVQVTYGGKVTTLPITKEIQAISVSEFIDETSGTYEVRGVIVGPASTTDATELLIMDPETNEVVGIYNTGMITSGTDKLTIDETICKPGDEVVVTLSRSHYTSTGTPNAGKYFAKGDTFKETCIVLSSGNSQYPDPENASVVTISSQEELRSFLLDNSSRHYQIVKLVGVNGVRYNESLRIFFGDEVTSYSEQQVNYSGTSYCSPLLSAKNQNTYYSNWLSEFDNNTSTDYESPATCAKAIYAVYLGGNSYYEHFVILDDSYFTEDTSTGGTTLPDLQEVNIHTQDKGEAPALHLIRNKDGSYGGTLSLNKYGEGAPLNGELDHLDSVYYSYNDYYNIKCTSSRVLVPNFAPYQQTMADSDGIASALMVFNYLGKDVSGEYSEENLVKAYEAINETTVYGSGTTADGLVNLFTDKGVQAENTTAKASSDIVAWIQATLKEGKLPIVYYHQDTKERFVVVIGYDNMGTPSTGDDVVIFANPYDAYDHYQDGYQNTKAGFFKTWACAVDQAGNTTRKCECLTVTPDTPINFEYSDVDELITNPSIADRHLLTNLDGSVSGAYNYALYGGGARYNGWYSGNNYQYSAEHFTYNYYAYPDIHNMTNTESRAVLTGFSAFQQSMASSCGISSTLNTLNYLGYDLTKLTDYIDDPSFGEIVEGDYGKIQEAIVKIYMKGDDYFDNPSHKFNNYGGVGAGNLSKVPQAIGYYDTEMGRYYRSAFSKDGATAEDIMPFPTYESFLAFAKEQLYAGQPIIFCGPNHWRVIIGIDDMGTESPYDDIVFLADSSDAWDHYIDGFDTEAATSFYSRWYNGGRSTNQQYILIKGSY